MRNAEDSTTEYTRHSEIQFLLVLRRSSQAGLCKAPASRSMVSIVVANLDVSIEEIEVLLRLAASAKSSCDQPIALRRFRTFFARMCRSAIHANQRVAEYSTTEYTRHYRPNCAPLGLGEVRDGVKRPCRKTSQTPARRSKRHSRSVEATSVQSHREQVKMRQKMPFRTRS